MKSQELIHNVVQQMRARAKEGFPIIFRTRTWDIRPTMRALAGDNVCLWPLGVDPLDTVDGRWGQKYEHV